MTKKFKVGQKVILNCKSFVPKNTLDDDRGDDNTLQKKELKLSIRLETPKDYTSLRMSKN